MKSKITNCYIHIPFCNTICSYCDFCKLYYVDKYIDKYLDKLEEEINSIYQGEVLETIYIGGGTPSSLNIKQLERLFNILEVFKRSKDIEFTIESNFENITKEKLLLYKKYGINRLSFGLESISKKNLEFLNRNISKEKINDTISICRELGFNNINVDLMYALPVETIEDVKDDLNYIFLNNQRLQLLAAFLIFFFLYFFDYFLTNLFFHNYMIFLSIALLKNF